VVFFQDHPDKLVALVIGVGPLILFFGWLFFYAWLARPADMMTHSFVRFPWVAGLAAGVTAAYRGVPRGFVGGVGVNGATITAWYRLGHRGGNRAQSKPKRNASEKPSSRVRNDSV
jgi:hypothetical protein